MSVAEIKEELTKLTPEERREIAAVLEQLETVPEDSEGPSFEEAMDIVFRKHDDVLRLLAQ